MFSLFARNIVDLARRSLPIASQSAGQGARRFVALSLGLALSISEAIAADIRVLPGSGMRGSIVELREPAQSRPLCDIELSGQIMPGDLDQLREAFTRVIGTRWAAEVYSEPPYRPLCLNSPGGSLGEAIRIAQFVHENSITTILPPGSTCQSACSWVFMLGNAEADEGGGPSRAMHYTARLSIHAPSIDFGSSDTIRREPVERAFNQVIQGLGVVLAIANQVSIFDARPFIDSDFIEMAFSHVGEDWFEIDTVHKAGRWRIEVFGFEAPEQLDERAAWDLCNNTTSIWLRPWSSVLERYGTSAQISLLYTRSAVSRRGQFYHVSGVDDGYVGHSCVVGTDGRFCGVNQSINPNGPTSADEACDMSDFATVRFISERDGSALAVFPGETLLSDLPRASARVRARALLTTQDRPLSCWLTSPNARVANVNEYTNLRRQPDFSAPVIRQVPLGERVRAQRADNITIIGQERDRQSCISACQAFGRNPGDRTARDRAQQCIQDNMLWYEITDARGNRGWVSRRFLEEVQ